MAELTQKYVPGAPPPSKIQPVKKKRTKAKTKEPLESGLDDATAALAEDSDLLGSKDAAAGQVQRETSQIPEDEPKAAHGIAELINKRLKAVTKKIVTNSGAIPLCRIHIDNISSYRIGYLAMLLRMLKSSTMTRNARSRRFQRLRWSKTN